MNGPAAEIHVHALEVLGRVGVTENERAQPQRLVLNITLWPKNQFTDLEDDITRTVNYAAVAVAAQDVIAERCDKLIETLADAVAARLLTAFAIAEVKLEVRKFVVPGTEYVAVTVHRNAS
ncbi:MAG: dihydroneopterin aldolase [Chthoniobacterales bacterium]|jgi:7,8-dihydroneopterin aldolase/epimerase/oxygenase